MKLVQIPDLINGVLVMKADCVDDMVHPYVVEALEHCVHRIMGPDDEHRLYAIHISSASDSHKYPSRHFQKKAVDISRLNGLLMSENPDGPTMYMTGKLQRLFEDYKHRRENFGPILMKKLGKEKKVSERFRQQHLTHIHWSVN